MCFGITAPRACTRDYRWEPGCWLGAEAPDTGVGSQSGLESGSQAQVETVVVGIQVDIRDQVDVDSQSRQKEDGSLSQTDRTWPQGCLVGWRITKYMQ